VPHLSRRAMSFHPTRRGATTNAVDYLALILLGIIVILGIFLTLGIQDTRISSGPLRRPRPSLVR
jgi:nitrate reductase gamma subunit